MPRNIYIYEQNAHRSQHKISQIKEREKKVNVRKWFRELKTKNTFSNENERKLKQNYIEILLLF